MKTTRKAFLFVIISTLFIAVGQFFFKWATNNGIGSVDAIITNIPLFVGIILYAIGTVFFILALKEGELSVLYPIYATTFVWVVFISIIAFGETMNLLKIFGVVLIVLGVSYMGVSNG